MFIGQLTQRGFELASREAVRAAQVEFSRAHCVTLEKFLEPRLLEWACSRLCNARFCRRVGEGEWGERTPSVDEKLDDREHWGALLFVMNDSALFGLVEHMTGCPRIGSFSGTVYRMRPGMGHRHSWHNDIDGNRLVALSLNLSGAAYSGGRLQLADRSTRKVLCEVANTGTGNAVVFALGERLEHRVTDVGPGEAKLSLAGWFVREPAYRNWLEDPFAWKAGARV